MLSPSYLDSVPDSMVELYSELEQNILADMARRISNADFWVPSAQWDNQKLKDMGALQEYILDELSKITKKSKKQLKKLMQEAGVETVESTSNALSAGGLSVTPLNANKELQAVLNEGYVKTNKLFRNITKTTASGATKQLYSALDLAWLQVTSGAFDYNTAIRNAIKSLSAAGVQCVNYKGGRTETLEVAVRRATMTGINQTSLKMQWELANELGLELVETSAHAGARPEHAVWQGKVFCRTGRKTIDGVVYEDFRTATGYGTGAGLGGWNCRHSFGPYMPGTSRAYSDELLEHYSAKTIEYNGKMYTEYEASQIQRYQERQIRRWKRENVAMKAAGQDTLESASKIRSWQERQKDFVKQTGLKRQGDRE